MKIIEIIIVIVILGIISAILLSAFSEFRSNGYLIDAETHIVVILRDARSRTLASRGGSQYGVHFEEARAVLFIGNTYNPLDTVNNEIYILPLGVRISDISLGGGGEIIYTRLTGTPSVSGTVTIQLRQNTSKTKIITISAAGATN